MRDFYDSDFPDKKTYLYDETVLYGGRIGALLGIGGEICDSRSDPVAQKFTMTMNLGADADFTLDKLDLLCTAVLNPIW